ncbi:MAG: hypothetical protein QW767_03300 [Thermoprotei archaeon]
MNIRWFSVTAALGLTFSIALLFQFDVLSALLGLLLPFAGLIIYLFFAEKSFVGTEETHEPHTR